MEPGEITANEYIDADEPVLTFEIFEMTNNEILADVANPEEEKEQLFEGNNVIEDDIQPLTKYEVMRALEVLQICTFYDAENGDEMLEMHLKFLAAVVLVFGSLL